MSTSLSTTPTIVGAVSKFIHDIDGIKSAEEIACTLLQSLAKKSSKEFSDLSNEFKVDSEEDSEELTFYVPLEHNKQFRKLRRRQKLTNSAMYQTPRALLVAMVSSFDAYLGRLLRCIYYLRPERIDASDRTLTFSQLVDLESLDAAREHVISKEIEAFLRKSHVEHFDYLENLLDMPLRKGLDSWPKFVEITQRRNLFVHSDGVISQQYLDVCDKNGVDVGDASIGGRLFLDGDYFRESFECFYEIGVKLAHVIWRKLSPDQIETADTALNSITYELLSIRRYRLAHNLSLFGTLTLKKHSSALNRRMLLINRAIAAKFGKIETDASPLKLEDWSDCGLPFKLAISVLHDEFDEACSIMRKIGSQHELVDSHAYGNWPLFTEFRGDERFLKTYKTLFGTEFNVTDAPEKSESPGSKNIALKKAKKTKAKKTKAKKTKAKKTKAKKTKAKKTKAKK